MRPPFLKAEPLIVARLQEQCPAARAVLTPADLAGVVEKSQVAPALHVVFDGFTVKETNQLGLESLFQERWLVVAAVKHAAQGKGAAGLRGEAGLILLEAYRALAGWKPADDLGWMIPATPPPPVIGDGYGYFPLAWSLQYVVQGDD